RRSSDLFIYGSVKGDVFQPLDGQQRLTTLFLLHWYVAIMENKLDVELKNLLTQFTYETRTSSKEFCIDLINKGIVCDNGQTISELIIDSSWFFLSWKRDPTIKSMLTMLDAIHQKFKDSPEVWNKLNNITFHYIELQNFGLSDDLYIKMNARGKPLTDFENFKAKFEQHIDKWENYSAPTKTFAHKIDTVWTDLFWRYKEKIERIDDEGRVTVEYRIDDHITNFIAATVINYYAQNLEIQLNEEDEEKVKKELEKKIKAKNVTDNAVKRERIERRITTLFNNPREITFNDLPTQGAFEYLVECFDRYSQNNSTELKFDVDLWKYCED